jgi:photosynthetic reaction center H subunit
MQIGYLTAQMDVAQVALYAFWLFFAGLIFYLRTEDKREGYPLVTERPGERKAGFPQAPPPKTFLLADGTIVLAPNPNEKAEPHFDGAPVFGFPGSPMEPLGNPLLSAVGPSAYALRADVPDKMLEDGSNRVLPLRVATDWSLEAESPQVIGMPVLDYAGVTAGTVTDLWVDRIEAMVRYYEVKLDTGASVLVPNPLINVNETEGFMQVLCVTAAQFADAPKLGNADQITLLEEDKVQAYFGSGHLYANPERSEPIL